MCPCVFEHARRWHVPTGKVTPLFKDPKQHRQQAKHTNTPPRSTSTVGAVGGSARATLNTASGLLDNTCDHPHGDVRKPPRRSCWASFRNSFAPFGAPRARRRKSGASLAQVWRKFACSHGTTDLHVVGKRGACRVGASVAQVLAQVANFGKTRAQEFTNTVT
jgi:hypothetical protein